MKSVGELLAAARQNKNLSFTDLSKKTKIQEKYLKDIEKNNFSSLPSGPVVKGFIRNVALTLEVDVNTIMAMFRRDFVEDELGKIIPRGLMKPIRDGWTFTPRTGIGLGLVILSLLVGGFFIRQIYLFYSGPSLSLAVPKEGAVVASPMRIEGEVSVDAVLEVNNKQIKVDQDGKFVAEIQLSEGEHTIVVTAVDRNGKRKTIQRFVNISQK